MSKDLRQELLSGTDFAERYRQAVHEIAMTRPLLTEDQADDLSAVIRRSRLRREETRLMRNGAA